MFERLRQAISGLRWRRLERRRTAKARRRPLDRLATYRAITGETWTFDGRHICCNGERVEEQIDGRQPDCIPAWCAVADAMHDYRDWVYAQGWPRYPELSHAVDAVHGKIVRTIHRFYEERVAGVALAWDDQGELLVNRLPVRMVMDLYETRPTQKAYLFLCGVARRLALILARQGDRAEIAGTMQGVRNLYDALCLQLAQSPVSHPLLLSAPRAALR